MNDVILNFSLEVIQTAIGSGLGFLLGMLAFRKQQETQTESDKKQKLRNSVDAINRLKTSAFANIESITESKLSIINNLKLDLEKIENELRGTHELRNVDLEKRIKRINKISLFSFYIK